ncbi:MAG: hypothetical protein ACREQ5_00060 [Candidatus Dormibacteria bacterium]
MLQRNTSGYPLQLPTTIPPVRIEPGGDVEFPERLAGCTPVSDLETGAQPDSPTSRNANEQPQDTTSGNTPHEALTSSDGGEQPTAHPTALSATHVEEA